MDKAGALVEKGKRPPPPLKSAKAGFPEIKKVQVSLPPPPKPKPPKPLTIEELIAKSAEEEESNEPAVDNSPFDEKTPRFDFEGHIIAIEKETPLTMDQGLHHHNDHPSKPGYAIYELATMARSKNLGQRSFAFQLLATISHENPGKFIDDFRSLQLPRLSVFALEPPTSQTITYAAVSIILSFMISYPNSFSLYPYPAVPPPTSRVATFDEYIPALVAATREDYRLFQALALLTPISEFDVEPLAKLPTSIHLLQFARAAYIQWGKVFGQVQALESINSEDINIAMEAAALLRLLHVYPDSIDSYPMIIKAILLSRCDSLSTYTRFIDEILGLCPDPFAVEFIALCSKESLITKKQAEIALENADFSPSKIQLLEFCGHEIKYPPLPTSEKKCWDDRLLICGASEYILHTKDFSLLPKILPCLYSFVDPAAEILIQTIFGFSAGKERPIDPRDLFSRLETGSYEEVLRLLSLSHYFPVHYMTSIFARDDVSKLNDEICQFIDSLPDPLPANSIRQMDVGDFFNKFTFDCFGLSSFQKFAYLCIANGADIEVRHHFWNECSQLLGRIRVEPNRKDIFNWIEPDRSVIEAIFGVFKVNKYNEDAPFMKVAVNMAQKFLIAHKGEAVGQVLLERTRDMYPEWANLILSFLK